MACSTTPTAVTSPAAIVESFCTRPWLCMCVGFWAYVNSLRTWTHWCICKAYKFYTYMCIYLHVCMSACLDTFATVCVRARTCVYVALLLSTDDRLGRNQDRDFVRLYGAGVRRLMRRQGDHICRCILKSIHIYIYDYEADAAPGRSNLDAAVTPFCFRRSRL